MKALVLTSDSLRHRYFAQAIARLFEVPYVLSEAKKNYYVPQREQSLLVREHFDNIAAAEKSWFSAAANFNGAEHRHVPDINSEALIIEAVENKFDVLCLFGTAILGQSWLEAFKNKIVNLHLGLSPFYRGSATLFWPFVNRELQYLGTTIHLATTKVDAGSIITRIDADLRPNENYYAITSRLIRDSIDRFPSTAFDYLTGKLAAKPQEAIAGKLYRKKDFSKEALVAALAYVGEGLSPSELNRIEAFRACRYSQ